LFKYRQPFSNWHCISGNGLNNSYCYCVSSQLISKHPLCKFNLKSKSAEYQSAIDLICKNCAEYNVT